MNYFIHRINTIDALKTIPQKYGVEIDVRSEGGQLVLNHDPIDISKKYDDVDSYLKEYVRLGLTGGIIFNLKEAGLEARVIALAEQYKIENYFLLDVEFPYLYRATRKEGVRKIAVRYSEAEPIEAALAQIVDGVPLLDWIWIDTNTKLPLTSEIVKKITPFKTCLVCPERWGRPEDISVYAKKMHSLNFTPTAIMTSLASVKDWENAYDTI